MAISYSRASKYETCPAMFEAIYIKKVKDVKGLPLLVGIFLHDLIDRYFKHLIKTEQPSDFAYYERAFEEAWASDKRKGIPEAMHGELLELVYTTRQGVILTNISHVVGSELSIALDRNYKKVDWFSKDAFIRMKIDRLDIDPEGNTLVWDYKSGFKLDDVDESHQLKLYGFAVKSIFPNVETVRVELYYPRMDITKWKVLTDDDIEEGRRWICAISDLIEAAKETDSYPATPGLGCGTCPIFEDCPERSSNLSDLPPETISDAEDIFARLLLVEQERKGLQERLKIWIASEGAVVLNGKMCDLIPVVKKHFPGDLVKKVLEDNNIYPMDYLKGDGKKLKKLAKDDKRLGEALEAISIDQSCSQFKIKNARV